MKMASYHIAQVNIGRIRAELNDPIMKGFVDNLETINLLAEASPGFVWRLQTDEGNATYLRPFNDERTLLNMSIWQTVEQLEHYVYRTAHVEFLRRRHAWFERFSGAYSALWWVPVGHVPGIDEAKKRVEHLDAHGPAQFAFTFKKVLLPDADFQQGIDWSSFVSCAAG
jgi:hypothetical protein